MNIQKLFALVLAFVLACNISTVSAADKAPKQNNQPAASPTPVAMNKPAVKKQEDRYSVVGEFVKLDKVGFTQPKYTGPATLNGLGLKSASELGIAGKSIYNEYERSARVVVLAPSAKVYYDTGSLEPLYLEGCMIDGKTSANRIKLLQPIQKAPEPKPEPVAVVTSTPTPEPKPVVVSKTTTNFVADKETRYDVRFESGRGKIALIPAIEVDETAVVVDIPKPTVRANGRVMSLGDE